MRADPYLIFDGRCREAFTFYQQLLGGDLDLVTAADMPGLPCPADWGDRLIHACLRVGDVRLMGSDCPPGVGLAGKCGFHASLAVDSLADAERLFTAFSQDGAVTMPLGATPWAEAFAMVTDRFGVPWMINLARAELAQAA